MPLDWSSEGLAAGLACYRNQEFFDAHEHWEDVWRQLQDPEKNFLQGLIQVTAAFHHHSRENLRGFKSLLRAGLLKLEAFPAEHRGLKIERLRACARRWIAALENEDSAHRPGLPKISQIRKSGEARSSIET